MRSPVRTLLFVLAATLANLLVTAAIFFGLLGLYGLTLGRLLKPASAAPALLACFILAIVLAALLYRRALKFLRERWDLEKRIGLK